MEFCTDLLEPYEKVFPRRKAINDHPLNNIHQEDNNQERLENERQNGVLTKKRIAENDLVASLNGSRTHTGEFRRKSFSFVALLIAFMFLIIVCLDVFCSLAISL